MADQDNSSNTPYGSPDFKQNDLVRDYLTKLAQFISGKPVSAGASTPWFAFDQNQDGASASGQNTSLPENASASYGAMSQLAAAINELSMALRAFQSTAGQSVEGQNFLFEKLSESGTTGFFQKESFSIPGETDASVLDSRRLSGEVSPPLGFPPPGENVAQFPQDIVDPIFQVAGNKTQLQTDRSNESESSAIDFDSLVKSSTDDIASTTEEFKQFLYRRDAASSGGPAATQTFNEMPGVMSHLIDGTDHMQDVASSANMYRDAMAMFNRRVVNILEGITNDLRGDNSRLAEIERHFFQARTTL